MNKYIFYKQVTKNLFLSKSREVLKKRSTAKQQINKLKLKVS
jgi:hypothetical protein